MSLLHTQDYMENIPAQEKLLKNHDGFILNSIIHREDACARSQNFSYHPRLEDPTSTLEFEKMLASSPYKSSLKQVQPYPTAPSSPLAAVLGEPIKSAHQIETYQTQSNLKFNSSNEPQSCLSEFLHDMSPCHKNKYNSH